METLLSPKPPDSLIQTLTLSSRNKHNKKKNKRVKLLGESLLLFVCILRSCRDTSWFSLSMQTWGVQWTVEACLGYDGLQFGFVSNPPACMLYKTVTTGAAVSISCHLCGWRDYANISIQFCELAPVCSLCYGVNVTLSLWLFLMRLQHDVSMVTSVQSKDNSALLQLGFIVFIVLSIIFLSNSNTEASICTTVTSLKREDMRRSGGLEINLSG